MALREADGYSIGLQRKLSSEGPGWSAVSVGIDAHSEVLEHFPAVENGLVVHGFPQNSFFTNKEQVTGKRNYLLGLLRLIFKQKAAYIQKHTPLFLTKFILGKN